MTRRSKIIIGLLGAIFTITIGAIQWWKYTHFGYNGLDLGIYSQVVWSLAHGHGFASSIHDPSYLGDHLELWLVPISWLYRLWSSPLLLLWIQTAVLASAVLPLALIAKKIISERATIVVTVLFVIHPLLYNVALYEFHALIFALPLLCWSIWFYVDKRYAWWLISLLAIVIVREDLPLIVAGWSIMAAVDRRSWKWWLAPACLAALWFPVAQQIIRQANHDGTYKYLAFYQWLGTTPSQMLTFPFRHPLQFLTTVVSFNNLGTVLGMTLSVGFLCFLRPKRLWPLLLILAQLLLSNAQPGSFLRIHYTIPYLPFLFWAAIEGYRELPKQRFALRLQGAGLGILIPVVVCIGIFYSSLLFGPIEWPWQSKIIVPATPTTYLRQALHDVQPNDRVLTTFAYLPPLANRSALYSLNYLYLGRRQYSEIPYVIPTDIDVAVIDWQQLYEFQFFYKTTVFRGHSGPQRIQDELREQGLHLVHTYGTVDVYRRDGTVLDAEATPTTASPAVLQTFSTVDLLGQPTLTVMQHDAQQTLVRMKSIWKSLQQKPDTFVTMRLVLDNGAVTRSLPQVLGQGLFPLSEWPAGTTWSTTNTFVFSAVTTLSGSARLEVIEQTGRYRLNRIRTFRPMIDKEKVVESIPLDSLRLN